MIFDKMVDAAQSLINAIHRHPFNQELAQGELPKEKFIFYLKQDALYLLDFSRALALTASKLSCQEQSKKLIEFSLHAMQAENELHMNYIKSYEASLTPVKKSPACFMYTNYLITMAAISSVEEAMASLLPCFWVYREVGRAILNLQSCQPNPYKPWIELYASSLFDESVQSAIEITNQLGHLASETIQEKMVAAFVQATKLEWIFWEGAYCMECWPLLENSSTKSI